MLITQNVKPKSKIYLPLRHFYDDYTEVEDINDLIIYNGNLYLNIFSGNDYLTNYSFSTNRIKYDNDWFDDFVLELVNK